MTAHDVRISDWSSDGCSSAPRHLVEQPEVFKQQLARLTGLHRRKTIEHWHALIDQDERAQLFRELIEQHYDPAYARSSHQHFLALEGALPFDFQPNTDTVREQALDLLTHHDKTTIGRASCRERVGQYV